MKYSPANFAKAFCDVLQKTSKGEQRALLRRFVRTLEKYGAIKDGAKVLSEIKKIIAEKEGISIIKIETARELDQTLTEQIKKSFNKNSDFTFKINPDLIAGVKIMVDDKISIDNSLKRRLKCMK